MLRPELIAFDLDGTLVDSAPDLAYSVDEMLGTMGRAPAGIDQVRAWIGNGIPMLVKRALTGEMWPEAEPERYDEALGVFMGVYEGNVCRYSSPFAGVLEGLEALKSEGYRTACITNKHSRFTLPLLAQLGLAQYLDFVGCGDQFEKHKPDPCPLLKTADHFGLAPEQCVMVGDSANDVEAARAAGFSVLCVPYGYRSCEHVEDLRADGVVQSLAELPALFGSRA
jgi:phosphoglycolate phosphatase